MNHTNSIQSYLFAIIMAFVAMSAHGNANAQTDHGEIKVSGAMRNVMRKGELQGTMLLDTISNKKHLYGLGPVEYLKGELLVMDGKSYVSSIREDGTIKMEETYAIKAPFFVYGVVDSWEEHILPLEIQTLPQLESYIDGLTKDHRRPFAFKVKGRFEKIKFHIQNLPNGAIVRSPEDAHQGQRDFERKKAEGELVGFFSTAHQAVFTHHDTFLHIHFINAKRSEMGHLDELLLGKDGKRVLYLPRNTKL